MVAFFYNISGFSLERVLGHHYKLQYSFTKPSLICIFLKGLKDSNIISYQGVGIQEDALGVLREAPAVQLGEGDAQLRAGEQGQVRRVSWVQHVYADHLLEHLA